MVLDALSETLRVVRLTGAIFIQGRFTAPWCYASPSADVVAPHLEPGADRVVIYHLITEGECWCEMDDGTRDQARRRRRRAVPARPRATGWVPRSTCRRPSPGGSPTSSRGAPARLNYGGGGAVTKIVCGYMACDHRIARMLLAGLPPLVRVSVRGSNAGAWLESSLRYAISEARSPRPGGAGVLAKLSELLFIEVLRLAMHQQSEGRTGWLAGLGDRVVGPALNAMHAHPARPWTLDTLAREANTSRSVLAERFQQLVGVAPMQYLAQWRMTVAAHLLCRSDAPLARIAEDVGYQTDTAFSRAFRREFGVPPAAWRRRQAKTVDEGAEASRH